MAADSEVIANKVLEYCSTLGVDDFLLTGGAVGTNRTFSARFADQKIIKYHARRTDGSVWEQGRGKYVAGTNTIIRQVVDDSSNGGSKVSWVSGDAPYVIFSPQDNAIVDSEIQGNLGDTAPAWLPKGGRWWNKAAGIGVRWIRSLVLGQGGLSIDMGRYHVSEAIFTASLGRAWLAAGAANLTIDDTHKDKAITFDVSAADRTATLPAGATLTKGFKFSAIGIAGTTHNLILDPNGVEIIDALSGGANMTIPPAVLVDVEWTGAQWRTNYVTPQIIPNAPAFAGARQTVAAGPVSSTGLPTFLPGTNGALSITSQNVSGTAPLVASSAGGWNASTGEPVDTVGYSSINLTWAGLTASRAAATPNFIYVTIAGGVLTPVSTILAPLYQFGGTPSVTAGQITFNIAEMIAYVGNGATAVKTALVVMGEAATDGSGVISTVAYAYNGIYDGPYTATLPGISTAFSMPHNIGVRPLNSNLILENTTTELGYAVGDQVTAGHATQVSSTAVYPVAVWSNNKTVGSSTGDGGSGSWFAPSRSSVGNWASLTLANWKYKFTATRGW